MRRSRHSKRDPASKLGQTSRCQRHFDTGQKSTRNTSFFLSLQLHVCRLFTNEKLGQKTKVYIQETHATCNGMGEGRPPFMACGMRVCYTHRIIHCNFLQPSNETPIMKKIQSRDKSTSDFFSIKRKLSREMPYVRSSSTDCCRYQQRSPLRSCESKTVSEGVSTTNNYGKELWAPGTDFFCRRSVFHSAGNPKIPVDSPESSPGFSQSLLGNHCFLQNRSLTVASYWGI